MCPENGNKVYPVDHPMHSEPPGTKDVPIVTITSTLAPLTVPAFSRNFLDRPLPAVLFHIVSKYEALESAGAFGRPFAFALARFHGACSGFFFLPRVSEKDPSSISGGNWVLTYIGSSIVGTGRPSG